jgi:hypothetical protein
MDHNDDDSPIARLAMMHPYVVAFTVVSEPVPPVPPGAGRAKVRRRRRSHARFCSDAVDGSADGALPQLSEPVGITPGRG